MLAHAIQIVFVQSACVTREAKDLDQKPTWIRNACRAAIRQHLPTPDVLFRPEEVHLVSSQRVLATPSGNRQIDVGDYAVRRDG